MKKKIILTYALFIGVLILYECADQAVMLSVFGGRRPPLWVNWIYYAVFAAVTVKAALTGRVWRKKLLIGKGETAVLSALTASALAAGICMYMFAPVNIHTADVLFYSVLNIVITDLGGFIIALALLAASCFGKEKIYEKN